MIEARSLTKRYGDKVAVDDLSFVVRPGIVTGFLGPNGAGKSTTMRMIMGLDAPTSGGVTVNGMAYRQMRDPLREVGALLEARSIHSGRSAFNHLLALGQTAGIGKARVNEVIELVGIADVARRRAGSFSLGMGQRLGLASALLGDPHTLILDEPVNGLDPDGIRWIRNLLKHLADEGRTVFVSSHLMSEMAQTAEHLIVIGRGRLIADTTVSDIIARASGQSVLVRTPDVERLMSCLAVPGAQVAADENGVITVTGLSTDDVGILAARANVTLLELTAQRVSLEDAFMDLTKDAVEYHGHEADEASDLVSSGSTP